MYKIKIINNTIDTSVNHSNNKFKKRHINQVKNTDSIYHESEKFKKILEETIIGRKN